MDVITSATKATAKSSNIQSQILITIFTNSKDMQYDAMKSLLYDYCAGLVKFVEQELFDYQLPVKVLNVSPDYGRTGQAQLDSATRLGSIIHLNLKAAYHEHPLKFPSHLSLRVSEFDQSLLPGYLFRHLEHWGLNPWMYQAAYQLDFQTLKQGCIPISLSVGDYHSSEDICAIEKSLPRLKHAISRALINYLYPRFVNPEVDFCIRSQGSERAAYDEGLIAEMEVPFS